MAVPSIEVSIAFATDPAATPTWTDVTSYVQSVTWRRGRAHELDQYATGQLGLLLDNRDRRFEPEYAGSPYAPNVVPMRRVRVQAVHSAVTYPLFAGSINNWAVDYPGDADHWLDSDVSVSGMDGLGVLALARLTADFAQHSSLTRIGAVLDAVGWPAADRSLGAAQQSVAAVSLTEASALSHLQAVVEAENGAIFADRAGVITTFNRHNRLRPSPTYVATYSDAGTLHYKKYKRGTAADRIVNDARVTRTDGTLQRVQHAASQTKYYPRSISKSGGQQWRDTDAFRAASFYIGRYREPLNMLELTIDPHEGQDAHWVALLSLDLNSPVSVRKQPPGGGADVTAPYYVDEMRITYTAVGGDWAGVFRLTPADTTAYWLLGVAGRSELGVTTLLAY